MNFKLLKIVIRADFVRNLTGKPKMSDHKKIAVCQMTSVGDKAANLKVVSTLVGDAAKENVQVCYLA